MDISPFESLQRFMQRLCLVDVARAKVASQSSYSRWSTALDADGAISATFPDDFGFHTNEERDPWWQVDLCWEYPVELIVVHNRRRGGEHRADGIEVSISQDQVNWTLIHSGLVRFSSGSDGVPLTLPVGGRPARYVRMQLPGVEFLHLARVEVFSTKSEALLAEIAGTVAKRCRLADGGPVLDVTFMGTSNSLMTTGYTVALRERPDFSIRANLSLGSSHPPLVAFRWDADLATGSRFIVIDLNVNQQRAMSCDVSPANAISQVFFDVLAKCHRIGAIPIILILPEGWSYHDGEAKAFAGRRVFVDLCEQYGIPYFDGYRFIEIMARETGLPPIRFLSDTAHVDHRLRRCFGDLFATALVRAAPAMRLGERSAQVESLAFVPVTMATCPGATRSMLSNSLLSTPLLQLTPGHPAHFEIARGSVVVGLVFNMSVSNAALRVQGKSSTVKNLNTSVADPTGPSWIVVWSLLGQVAAGADGITVECVQTGDMSMLEPNDHGNVGHRVGVDTPMIELAGLIVAQPASAQPIPTITGCDLDLFNFIAAEIRAEPTGPSQRSER